MWFPPAKRGLPLGIWASATPMGNMITWLIIPRLVTNIGWRGAWWFSTLFTVLVFIPFWVLVRPAPVETRPAGWRPGEGRRKKSCSMTTAAPSSTARPPGRRLLLGGGILIVGQLSPKAFHYFGGRVLLFVVAWALVWV